MKLFSRWALGAWVALLAFDGVIRFGATFLGFPLLAYVKDAVLISLLGVCAVRMAGRLSVYPVVTILAGALVYGACVGLLAGNSPVAVVFALKMFLPFVTGYIVTAQGYTDSAYFTRLYRVIAPCIALGILLDVMFALPWEGLTYDFAGVTLEASRQWTMFGLSRPAGFGRSSFESAIGLYMLLAWRMTLRGKDDSNPVPWTMKLYDTTVGLSALGAILITTSKTSLLALGILAAASLLRIGARHRWLLVTQMSRLALALVMLGAFALTLVPFALPTEAAGNLDDTLSEYGALPRLLFHSLVERAQDVWPRAVASMSDPLAWITGRGLGGVGAPQMYFAPDSYNPADNIHVYLWLSFGGVVLLLLLVFLLALIGRLVRSPGPDAALVAFLTTLLAFGATLNVIEASMLMAGLGVLLASHEAARDHGH